MSVVSEQWTMARTPIQLESHASQPLSHSPLNTSTASPFHEHVIVRRHSSPDRRRTCEDRVVLRQSAGTQTAHAPRASCGRDSAAALPRTNLHFAARTELARNARDPASNNSDRFSIARADGKQQVVCPRQRRQPNGIAHSKTQSLQGAIA